ncbi:MAG: hypothetical protein WDO14_20300 [Bacteroidota bacterium]
MELSIDNKVIGIVEHEIQKHARIRVVGLKSNKGEIITLTETEAIKSFPPKGYIFEPGFFQSYKFHVEEVILFDVEQNTRAEGDQDRFRINVEKRQNVKSFGVPARTIKNFKQRDLSTDLSSIGLDDLSDGEFYGVTNEHIIGRLRLKNGKLESANSNFIRLWHREGVHILEHTKGIRLDKAPEGSSQVLDCMDDKQLFEWFRSKLKTINPDYVQFLDIKGKWREEIPKILSQSDSEHTDVEKIRLKRLDSKFELYRLSINEIMSLADTSQQIKKCVTQSLEDLKEELKINYADEIEKHERHLNEQAQMIDARKLELEHLEKESADLLLNIQNLQSSKDRLLNDFTIIKEVLSTSMSKNSIEGLSYVIETAKMPNHAMRMSDRQSLVQRIQFQLSLSKLNTKYAERLLDVAILFRAFFVKDIKLGLAFVEATGNARYIIQQVEPDWLRFKDLWDNSLGAIWSSAHANPENIHVLFLQDINLSSPECYARPLIDCLIGIRQHIPFGNTTMPKNLRIIATIAPSENPKLGLPMLENTFLGWGAVGFREGLYNQDETAVADNLGYITTGDFLALTEGIKDETIPDRIKSEFNKVFDGSEI